jgi:hypothetical protein
MQKQVITDCFYEMRSGELVASPASETGFAFAPRSAVERAPQTYKRC